MRSGESIWKFSLVFVLIHMSSGASVIALSDIALTLCTAATIALAYYRRVKLDKHFFTFTYVFICLAFFYMMQFGWLNYSATIRLFIKILYAYLTIKIIGWRFMHVAEDVIGKLAMISLPLFAVQFFVPDLMMGLNGFLEVIIPQVPKGEGVDYSNSILFTVNPWALERNSGFMWEPGAFAAMLSIGLFLNLIIQRCRANWKLFAMALAMITAQSTAGSLLLVLLGIFWLINLPLKTSIIAAPALLVAVILAMSLGSGMDKVKDRYANWDKTIENQDSYADDREGISVGRFGSFVLDWNDLLEFPIIGYGLQETERTTGRYIHLVRANGMSDYLVRFGLLGFAFLIWNLSRTFYRFGSRFQMRGLWMGTLIVLLLSFSNPILMAPFFFALQFYYIAIHSKDLKTYEQHSRCHTYVQS